MSNTLTLPLSNVINVSITNTPTGLIEPNVNVLALLSQEVPVNNQVSLQGYAEYVSAAQVQSDWGSSSLTYAMANNVFSQNPNILAGDGYLVVVPMQSSVSATPGYVTTANISANVVNFPAVTNGNLKVTIGGVANNLTGLNFSACLTLADIATVLQNALPTTMTITTNVAGTALVFTNNKVGTAASVALAAYSGGGTDLTGATLLNTASATTTAGVNSTGETVSACINRSSSNVFYAGVMTTLNLEDAAITVAATAVQALDLVFLHHLGSSTDILGIGTTVTAASQTKTRLKLYTQGQAAANLMKAAWAGRLFSTNYDGSNTCGTMNLQTLANVNPDPGITQTMYLNANTAGVDLYVSYFGVPACYATEGNNYDDVIYGETAGFNYLAQTNTKIPQTEPGMSGLKSAYAHVMNQFVTNGFIAPGSWTSSETFGNQTLFLANITNYGYYIYSQPVALQASSQRALRQAPLVQIAGKLAGALQQSSVQVVINP
jgi:hypothetical protein